MDRDGSPERREEDYYRSHWSRVYRSFMDTSIGSKPSSKHPAALDYSTRMGVGALSAQGMRTQGKLAQTIGYLKGHKPHMLFMSETQLSQSYHLVSEDHAVCYVLL